MNKIGLLLTSKSSWAGMLGMEIYCIELVYLVAFFLKFISNFSPSFTFLYFLLVKNKISGFGTCFCFHIVLKHTEQRH